MSKQTEELGFALDDWNRRFSAIIIFKVSGSDLYVFNKEYRGLYHVSLHASGQLHLKLQGRDALRMIYDDKAVEPGKKFVVERSKTENKAVNPLNILIGTGSDWRSLRHTDSASYEKIPLPRFGKVARISVFYSNTDDLALFNSRIKSHQTILKSFPVHDGSFYALVHEEADDPGIVKMVRASSTLRSTPTSLPVDRDWQGDQYQVSFLPMTDTLPHYILMLMVMNWQDQ